MINLKNCANIFTNRINKFLCMIPLISFALYYFKKRKSIKDRNLKCGYYLNNKKYNNKSNKKQLSIGSKVCILPTEEEFQMEQPIQFNIKNNNIVDQLTFWSGDKEHNNIFIRLTRFSNETIEVWFKLILNNYIIYCLPEAPNTLYQNNGRREWSARGLRMEIIEPFRRWRITFKGLLRIKTLRFTPDDNDDDDQVKFVTFSFIWIACSDYVEFKNEVQFEVGKGYEQWGVMLGSVTLPWHTMRDDEIVKRDLYLRGYRQRWSGLDAVTWQNRLVQIQAVMPEGTMISLRGVESQDGLSPMFHGQIRKPNGMIQILNSGDIQIDSWDKRVGDPSSQVLIHLRVDGKSCSLVLLLEYEEQLQRCFHGSLEGNSWVARCLGPVAVFNQLQGYAHLEQWNRMMGPSSIQKKSPVTRLYDHHFPKAITEKLLVVSLDDMECRSSAFVGGKATSLALLRSLKDNTHHFHVPGGFCLTPNALAAHLNANPEIKQAIGFLSEAREKQLTESSLKAMELLRKSILCPEVESALAHALNNFLPDSIYSVAVRSSALGEDSEDVSAAGQNDTFLGVPIRAEPLSFAILSCWASLYSEAAIIYRRRHGQPVGLNSTMAVVIQAMVSPRSAGVLFTNHPVTADPSRIIITANYGLGESVVSATSEPDSIEVHRNWREELEIVKRTTGGKSIQIILEENEELEQEQICGTRSEKVSDSDRMKLCINDEEILQLASMGVQLEERFGDARDIEWAFDKNTGQLWILQARPITAQHAWTEQELLHEFDSALPSENEILTRANIGEVMPNICSTLTLSLSKIGLDVVFRWLLNQPGKYFDFGLFSSHNYLILNVLNIFRFNGPTLSLPEKVNFMNTLGNVLLTHDIHRFGIERFGIMSNFIKLAFFYRTLKILFSTNVNLALDIVQKFEFKIYLNNTDSDLLMCYNEINEKLDLFWYLIEIHLKTSTASSLGQIILASILANDKDEITPLLKIQMAKYLSKSKSKLISGEIPYHLNYIAKMAGDELAKAPQGETLNWLQKHRPEQAKELDEFLKRHGHRCLNEMEFSSETWSMNPELVCDILRSLCVERKNINLNKKEEETPNIPNAIGFKGFILNRFLVPWIQKQVKNRELSKYAFVMMVDKFRQNYRQLAQMMFQKGRLPEIDLIWYLTHTEIKSLIQNHNPRLIDKAWRRQRFQKNWKDFKFPDLWTGIPIISRDKDLTFPEDRCQLVATPVSNGKVTSRACVVKTIEQAHQIKENDILITYSTDIGWSPYFPKISGLVTELGGLISHGAVVAREYGIPCLVGAHCATQLFKSGDTILLDANVGTVTLIETGNTSDE